MSNEKKFHVGIKALIENDNGEILVLKVNPEELKGNEHGIYWDLPGGRIKQDDSIEETLKNEIKEELGYAGDIDIVGMFHGDISNIEIPVKDEKFGLVLFVYLCRIDNMHDISLSFEHTEYKWASIDEAKKLLAVKFSKDFVKKLDDLKKHNIR